MKKGLVRSNETSNIIGDGYLQEVKNMEPVGAGIGVRNGSSIQASMVNSTLGTDSVLPAAMELVNIGGADLFLIVDKKGGLFAHFPKIINRIYKVQRQNYAQVEELNLFGSSEFAYDDFDKVKIIEAGNYVYVLSTVKSWAIRKDGLLRVEDDSAYDLASPTTWTVTVDAKDATVYDADEERIDLINTRGFTGEIDTESQIYYKIRNELGGSGAKSKSKRIGTQGSYLACNMRGSIKAQETASDGFANKDILDYGIMTSSPTGIRGTYKLSSSNSDKYFVGQKVGMTHTDPTTGTHYWGNGIVAGVSKLTDTDKEGRATEFTYLVVDADNPGVVAQHASRYFNQLQKFQYVRTSPAAPGFYYDSILLWALPNTNKAYITFPDAFVTTSLFDNKGLYAARGLGATNGIIPFYIESSGSSSSIYHGGIAGDNGLYGILDKGQTGYIDDYFTYVYKSPGNIGITIDGLSYNVGTKFIEVKVDMDMEQLNNFANTYVLSNITDGIIAKGGAVVVPLELFLNSSGDLLDCVVFSEPFDEDIVDDQDASFDTDVQTYVTKTGSSGEGGDNNLWADILTRNYHPKPVIDNNKVKLLIDDVDLKGNLSVFTKNADSDSRFFYDVYRETDEKFDIKLASSYFNRSVDSAGIFDTSTSMNCPVNISKPNLRGVAVGNPFVRSVGDWSDAVLFNGKFYFSQNSQIKVTNILLEWDELNTVFIDGSIKSMLPSSRFVYVATDRGMFVVDDKMVSQKISSTVFTKLYSLDIGIMALSDTGSIYVIQEIKGLGGNIRDFDFKEITRVLESDVNDWTVYDAEYIKDKIYVSTNRGLYIYYMPTQSWWRNEYDFDTTLLWKYRDELFTINAGLTLQEIEYVEPVIVAVDDRVLP